MPRIGVGIIGLSASGGWASIAHLPYLKSSDKYEIVAVTNSSMQSACDAIREYQLEHAKPYDDVSRMVEEPTVKLVVCAVAVFSHSDLIRPAILARKDVYVEWPLGTSTEQAVELAELAKLNHVKTVVGLQGRCSPLIRTLRRILQQGLIGNQLVSSMQGSTCTPETGSNIPKRYAYFKDRVAEGAHGQIMLTIYAGHVVDALSMVAGEPSSVAAELRTTWPQVKILDGDKTLESGVRKTADDSACLQGLTDVGVTYSITMRGGDAFEAGDAFTWSIVGDRGELRISGSSIMLNLGSEEYKVRFKDAVSGEVSNVETEEALDLPLPAQNIGQLYDDFAEGKTVPTFEDAVKRHRFVDALFQASEQQVLVKRADNRF